MSSLPCYCQLQPPLLSPIFSIIDPNKSFSQYYPNLICKVISKIDKQTIFIIVKGKRGIIFIFQFVSGCCNGKKQFSIPYSMNSPITCLTNSSVIFKKQKKEKAVISYLFIGYEDGCIDIYLVVENEEQEVGLKKQIMVQTNIPKQMPVINVQLSNNSLIVTYSYMIVIIQTIFSVKNPLQINKEARQRKLTFTDIPYHLNTHSYSEQDTIYIFNEINGSVCFNISEWKLATKINDCIRFLSVLPKHLIKYQKSVGQTHSTIIIGTTDDSLKFIDYNLNTVIKYVGFKNYPNCCFIEGKQQSKKPPVFWVGALDGTVTCFTVLRNQINNKKKQMDFAMQEYNLKYSKKVSEAGIMNLFVHGGLLIVKDTDYKISFFDIIKWSAETDRSRNTYSTEN